MKAWKKISRGQRVWIRLLIVLVILVLISAGVRLFLCYDSTQPRLQTEGVTVSTSGSVTFYDGPGTEQALIFYPGALVSHEAYDDLMQRTAAAGVDCFLVRMPLRMAMLDMGAAGRIMGQYSYASWYLGGHSLGGATACMYAQKNASSLAGLVLLGSYSSVDLTGTGLRVLSVTGSNDLVVNRDRQEKGAALLPAGAVHITLEGGNHAGYGTYGSQKGDGTALISGDKQRALTCRYIADFILQPAQ